MERIYSRLKAAAGRKSPLFLIGPTGSGKTTLARQVHEWSGRRGPFVSLNCAALPEGLAESELFGAAAGAYTDAKRAKSGYFEQASAGTLFLDEVGDLSPANQARLLKAVEEGAVVRVGEVSPRPTSCRIIAATSRLGALRQDLAYRLGGVVIEVPGLQSRRGEIMPLAKAFLVKLREEAGEAAAPALTFSPCAVDVLLAHDWPGNVRELHNVVEAAALDAEVAGRAHVVAADVAAAIARQSKIAAQTPHQPLPAWLPKQSAELLPDVQVTNPRWLQAWHLSCASSLFSREDYEASACAPRSTALRDLSRMVQLGILRRIPPRHYTWVAGKPHI